MGADFVMIRERSMGNVCVREPDAHQERRGRVHRLNDDDVDRNK